MRKRATRTPAWRFLGGVLSGLALSAGALAALSLSAPRPFDSPAPGGQLPTAPSPEAPQSAAEAPPAAPPEAAAPSPVPPTPEPARDALNASQAEPAQEPMTEPTAEPEPLPAVEPSAPAPAAPFSATDASPEPAPQAGEPADETSRTVDVEPPPPSPPAWRAHAVAFDRPVGSSALLAVVLNAAGDSEAALTRFAELDAPLTIVAETARVAALRAAGFEMLVAARDPQAGDAQTQSGAAPAVGLALQAPPSAMLREQAAARGLLLLDLAEPAERMDHAEAPLDFAASLAAPRQASAALLLETLREAERRAARDGEAVVVLPASAAALTALRRWAALPRLAEAAPLSGLAAQRVAE